MVKRRGPKASRTLVVDDVVVAASPRLHLGRQGQVGPCVTVTVAGDWPWGQRQRIRLVFTPQQMAAVAASGVVLAREVMEISGSEELGGSSTGATSSASAGVVPGPAGPWQVHSPGPVPRNPALFALLVQKLDRVFAGKDGQRRAYEAGLLRRHECEVLEDLETSALSAAINELRSVELRRKQPKGDARANR